MYPHELVTGRPFRPTLWDLVLVFLIGGLVCAIVISALRASPPARPEPEPGVSVRVQVPGFEYSSHPNGGTP